MALLRRFSFIMFFIGLVGCGGGDGGGFDGGGEDPILPVDPIVVSLEISNNVVNENSPATLTATVMKGSDPVVGEVVTFESIVEGDSPKSGTVSTDSSGIATITLEAGEVAGNGVVTASVSSGESATVSFINELLVKISLALSPEGEAVSEAMPLTIIASVMQGSTPIVGKLVSFTLDDEELAFFSPENGAVTTNNDGLAVITLHVGNKEGGGTITASIDSGDIINTVAFNSAGDGSTGEEIKVETINLLASNQQVGSSGADKITLTAIVKDVNNNLVEGATVSFSSTSGSIEHDPKIKTGADGKVTAILSTEAEPENRVIDISATSDFSVSAVC